MSTTTSQYGRIGEAAVISFFVKNGYEVFAPFLGNASADLVVLRDGKVERVEVKTTSKRSGRGYEVQLRSMRYNNTQTKINKFDASKSDLLAVYIYPEDHVQILASKDYNGRSTAVVYAPLV